MYGDSLIKRDDTSKILKFQDNRPRSVVTIDVTGRKRLCNENQINE